MMNRREILPGVFLTEIEGQYKKSRLSVYLASPLKRENLTQTAMLPFVLERGTAKLPDMTLLKRRLNALYGAALSTNYSSVQFSRVLEGNIDGVNGSLVAGGGDLSAQRTDMLFDVLLDPYTENAAFPAQWVDIEREKLRETIRSVINDKREYCTKLLVESFYAADERGLPGDGFEQDLDGIAGKDLYDAYRAFVTTAQVEVIYVGEKTEGLEEKVAVKLQAFGLAPAIQKPLAPVEKAQETALREEMEIEQAKLAFAFTPGRLLDRHELSVLRLACGILGASATSRLFVNVREKQSLCYYASAQPSYRAGGGILIDSGIDHGNAGRAREAILKELRDLATDGPTALEMEQIKLFYKNVLSGVTDSSSALANYCYGNIVKFGEPMSPQQELADMDAVTAEEVQALLAEMHLNTSCLLYGKGA